MGVRKFRVKEDKATKGWHIIWGVKGRRNIIDLYRNKKKAEEKAKKLIEEGKANIVEIAKIEKGYIKAV